MVVSVKWHVIVILICISLMADDVKDLFLCLFAVMLSSFMKCLFISSFHFLIGFAFFLSFLFYLFFGHAAWLVGFQLPNQGLNPGHEMTAPNPNH